MAIADYTWTTQAPDRYQSSPIAQRGFCRECGTPLSFEFISPDATMDITVGSFDHPGRFVPRHHFATESLHEAWIDTHTRPRIRSEDNPSTSNRWMDAVGKLPD